MYSKLMLNHNSRSHLSAFELAIISTCKSTTHFCLFIYQTSGLRPPTSFVKPSVPALPFSPDSSFSVSQDVVWAVWNFPRPVALGWGGLWGTLAEGQRKEEREVREFVLGSRCEVTSGWSEPVTKACCFSAGVHPSLLALSEPLREHSFCELWW